MIYIIYKIRFLNSDSFLRMIYIIYPIFEFRLGYKTSSLGQPEQPTAHRLKPAIVGVIRGPLEDRPPP